MWTVKKLGLLVLFIAVYFASISALPAQAGDVPPSPFNSFYGDATGDMIIAAADIAQMNRWMLGFSYAYDTVQPQTATQDWNTSDVTSDILIAASDISVINNWMLGFPVSVDDKPWALSNETLPASIAVNTPTAFKINLASTIGTNWGRAGLPIIANIDSANSTATGSLSGRTCAPIAGSRDQAASGGAQCALSVTITDWYGAAGPTKGLTETGTYGFSVTGTTAGALRIIFSITGNPPGLDIPAVSVAYNVTVNGGNQPPVISNLPYTKESRISKTSSFDVEATDPDIPPDVLTYSITDENCSFTPTIDSASGLVEWTCGSTPETCHVDVTVTDDDTPPLSDTKTLTIKCNNNPTLVGGYATASAATSISVSGDYAYVADLTNGLYIFDISNPASPDLVGQYDTPSSTFGIYSDGHYAYLTDYTWGLYIIDVSDPAAPSLVGTCLTTGNPVAVYAEGNWAYVADKASGLQIINISNPAAPVLWGNYDTPGEARNIYVRDGYAYVADTNSGLQIINVSNTSWPTFSGSYITSGQAYGVYVKGNYAYMASYDLEVIDVSDPAYPVLAGRYYPPDAARSVYLDGSFAYVAASSGGLDIVDISNPEAPTNAGNYNNSVSSVFDVEVIGNYAYTAYGMSGLQIIQVLYP